jgi:flagellar biogenesis protein FliO
MQSAGLVNRAGEGRQYGLATLLIELWRKGRGAKERRARQMELIELLPLGGKRQLMLVRCGEERFLVGGGSESVQTIVKLDGYPPVTERPQDELCK